MEIAKLKKDYQRLCKRLDEIMPTLSHAGEWRVKTILDDLHWLLFEREGPKVKAGRGPRVKIAYTVVEKGDVTAQTIIFIEGGAYHAIKGGMLRVVENIVEEMTLDVARRIMKKDASGYPLAEKAVREEKLKDRHD